MDTAEYAAHDALGLAALVRASEVSATELAAAAQRAHEETHARLNAVVEVYDDAVEAAAEAGRDAPFAGVPFLIKDYGEHFARRTVEYGSRLCSGLVAEEDDTYGALVKATGVTLVGRSNTPELSMSGSTENVLYGATSNPWRDGWSASGSSGGAAAAVAAGVVPIAHASDIGGSIRGPAAWC